jgi:hypothetical protein
MRGNGEGGRGFIEVRSGAEMGVGASGGGGDGGVLRGGDVGAGWRLKRVPTGGVHLSVRERREWGRGGARAGSGRVGLARCGPAQLGRSALFFFFYFLFSIYAFVNNF